MRARLLLGGRSLTGRADNAGGLASACACKMIRLHGMFTASGDATFNILQGVQKACNGLCGNATSSLYLAVISSLKVNNFALRMLHFLWTKQLLRVFSI
jgi:hypothetical protein